MFKGTVTRDCTSTKWRDRLQAVCWPTHTCSVSHTCMCKHTHQSNIYVINQETSETSHRSPQSTAEFFKLWDHYYLAQSCWVGRWVASLHVLVTTLYKFILIIFNPIYTKWDCFNVLLNIENAWDVYPGLAALPPTDDPLLSPPLGVNPGLAKGPSFRKAGSPPGRWAHLKPC